MNGEDDQSSPQQDRVDATLTRVLRQPGLTPQSLERLRSTVAGEWQVTLEDAQRRRAKSFKHRLPLSLAASLVCAAVGWWITIQLAPGPVMGLVQGDGQPNLKVMRRWRSDLSISSGSAVRVGQRLSVAGTSVIALEGGGRLFLKTGSSATLLAAHEIELSQGTLYLDFDPARDHGELVVRIPSGRVQHVGTQFQVTRTSAIEQVLVREGTVQISGTVSTRLQAGQALEVDQHGGTAIRPISPYDHAWQWTGGAIDSLEVEGQTALAFLRWYARSTGRHIDFADQSVRELAERTVLHGSIHHLSPDLIVRAVLATTSLAAEISESSIRISTAASTP